MNFHRHKESIDLAPIRKELEHAERLWPLEVGRKSIPVLRESDSIFVRKPSRKVDTDNDLQAVDSAFAPQFQQTLAIVRSICAELKLELGRVLFTRLEPGGQVYPHLDPGAYYAAHRRFHIIIQSDGSEMTCGLETAIMKEGELWEFDNKKVHSAKNTGTIQRVHLIFDART